MRRRPSSCCRIDGCRYGSRASRGETSNESPENHDARTWRSNVILRLRGMHVRCPGAAALARADPGAAGATRRRARARSRLAGIARRSRGLRLPATQGPARRRRADRRPRGVRQRAQHGESVRNGHEMTVLQSVVTWEMVSAGEAPSPAARDGVRALLWSTTCSLTHGAHSQRSAASPSRWVRPKVRIQTRAGACEPRLDRCTMCFGHAGPAQSRIMK